MNKVNYLESLNYKLSDEIQEDSNGAYNTYEVDGVTRKLYHVLYQHRLSNESQEEYHTRRVYIKEFHKKKKHCTIVWSSSNNKTVKDLKLFELGYKIAKSKDEPEKMEQFEKGLKEAHKRMLQSNMGTLNLKKIKAEYERVQDQEGEKEEAITSIRKSEIG